MFLVKKKSWVNQILQKKEVFERMPNAKKEYGFNAIKWNESSIFFNMLIKHFLKRFLRFYLLKCSKSLLIFISNYVK